MKKKIIVVGAGIIGASLAYHLAAKGAAVTVFDAQTKTGGVATPNTWAWINASWGNPVPYVKLRMQSMAMWRRLAAVHNQLSVNWCGGLLWDLSKAELVDYAKQQAALGYDVRLVDGTEAKAIEPGLIAAPKLAAYAAGEGMIEPATAVNGFVQAAEALGVRFITSQSVSQLEMRNGCVVGVMSNGELHLADEVVLASGIGTLKLLAAIGIHLMVDAPAGLLVHTEPTRKILNGLVMSPEFHVRQTVDGRLVLGSDFGGSQPGDDPAATAAELLAKLPGLVDSTKNLKMDYYTLGFRPTPVDGCPAIGRPKNTKGLYVAVTHSGITLAPALGGFGANEIMNDQRDALLLPYHPDRIISA